MAEITDLTRGIYRRIYSGFINGKRFNSISRDASGWFWRFQAIADDFGDGPADPLPAFHATVGNSPDVSVDDVLRWLLECRSVDLLCLYEIDGETYFHIRDFEVMQPAGKNGRRVQKYPIFDESRIIQGNPGESKENESKIRNAIESKELHETCLIQGNPRESGSNGSNPVSLIPISIPIPNNTLRESKAPTDIESLPKKKRGRKQPSEMPPIPPSLNTPEFLAAWENFKAHREAKRAKITNLSATENFSDFQKWGVAKSIEAIHRSIGNGWTGIFEPHGTSSNGKPISPRPAPLQEAWKSPL